MLGYRSLLAPIRKVPPEIFQQIFLYVCNRNQVGESFGERLPTRLPPVSLAQVCCMWHEVVKSSSCLWSTIHFQVIRNYSPDSASAWVEQIERLLELSGSAPLSIDVVITIEEYDFDDNDPPFQCVKMLALHSDRWSEASIDVHPELLDDMLHALHPIQGHLPLLQHLEFNAMFSETRHIGLFHNAPKLQSVQLYSETQTTLTCLGISCSSWFCGIQTVTTPSYLCLHN